MRRGKKITVILAALAVLLLIAVAVNAVAARVKQKREYEESILEIAAMPAEETAAPEATEAPADTAATPEPTATPAEATAVPAPTATPAAGTASTGSGSGWSSYHTGTSAQPTPTPVPEIRFPYTDAGTGLTVTALSSYDGIFLEDSSDADITGVAVIILKNNGKSDVEYAEITLTQGAREYYFEASAIPQNATVVVQEKNKQLWQDGTCSACTIKATDAEALEQSTGLVTVEENADGALVVTNVSGSDIPCVRIFYKFYSASDDAYIGGITYTAKLTDLAAGESVEITPSHYMAGYSRVVMVRTYNSAED